MPVRDLFGPGAHALEAEAALVDGQLYAEEMAWIRGAVTSRRAEFGTARVCARAALARLGIAPCPLVPGDDRAPRWPTGAVGSITHTHGHCAVVVAPSPAFRSIGLDVEVVRPLEADVERMILTARERTWLKSQPPARRDELLVALFCAKEAYYKCQYPLTGTVLDFGDVEIDLYPELGTFAVRVVATSRPAIGEHVTGRVAYEKGRVLCGIEVRT